MMFGFCSWLYLFFVVIRLEARLLDIPYGAIWQCSHVRLQLHRKWTDLD